MELRRHRRFQWRRALRCCLVDRSQFRNCHRLAWDGDWRFRRQLRPCRDERARGLVSDGSGDFNGDGRSDLLWRDRQSGAITDWLGQADGSFIGNFENAAASATKNWGFAGTGDFNGDGRDDILWHDFDGTITEWLGTATGGFVINPAAHIFAPFIWSVAGTGDFNGDGRTDILWQASDGSITNWLAQADGSFQGNFSVAAANKEIYWEVAAVGDFNGDGRDDILWRDFNAVTAWYGKTDGGFDTSHSQEIMLDYAWKTQPNPDLFG
jgi:FG-GAP-like repeat